MTTRIVNLRTRRKQMARDAKRKTATSGPAPSVEMSERDRAEAENRRARDRLDEHQREHQRDGHQRDGHPKDDGA